jgi:NAD(P)-dependent dehydrogenase (short-subunit alcohol dehydrogenase family)
MNVTVFGATGGTGRHVVKQALAQGHNVTAFVRDPTKLGLEHKNLKIVQGDASDAAAVERAVAGADAVISALGPTKPLQPGIYPAAARNIVSAMQAHGIRRLVAVTGAGVPAPQDQPKPINRFITWLLKTLDPQVLADSLEFVRIVTASDRDWTIVRGPRLIDVAGNGQVRVGWVGVGTGVQIPRADLADFMLKQVTDDTYLRQMPMISS